MAPCFSPPWALWASLPFTITCMISGNLPVFEPLAASAGPMRSGRRDRGQRKYVDLKFCLDERIVDLGSIMPPSSSYEKRLMQHRTSWTSRRRRVVQDID